MKAGDFAGLQSALAKLIDDARQHADVVVVTAGSLLRDHEWVGELIPFIERLADDHVWLSAVQEGLLLRWAEPQAAADAALLDIGGGSVQLVHGPSAKDCKIESWPFGTYAIEEKFDLKQGSDEAKYEVAAASLDKTLRESHLPNVSSLIVGSNIMGTFMRRLASLLDVSAKWDSESLSRAWRYCSSLPSDDFDEVFPQNPGFMYGADKAMLTAAVFANVLNVDTVVGTDASVSEGLAALVRDAEKRGVALAEAMPVG
ncbi:Ppx/GppA phosphatase family protein [Lentzea waywayandensis]|uniref:Ppx/GppA phosphatase family protein n=1 Tax=Lentzea waywayandensis TaxID=84724 RepID=A0A1I6ECV6_9PSEU|nr:hypothetical protein [Lentzea waywayandensis]SFR15535.1 Ppx/GppA phosphatase family protein [Lentzea waywayandensis]